MKQQNLCNSGFILLEAMVGVALFMIIMITILQGIVHITKQCIALKGRHKALCVALYSIEQLKKNTYENTLCDDVTQVVVQNMQNMNMPYTHSSVTWDRVTVSSALQSVTVYSARSLHE